MKTSNAEKPSKKWTPADAKRLQKLTRQIVKENGGDDTIIHRMAYECEVKARKSGQQNAGGMARKLAAQDSESTNDING